MVTHLRIISKGPAAPLYLGPSVSPESQYQNDALQATAGYKKMAFLSVNKIEYIFTSPRCFLGLMMIVI